MKRAFGLAIAFALLAESPAWAIATVSKVTYDDARQTFFIETTGSPQVSTRRLINQDRLVIEIANARLSRRGPSFVRVSSHEIRAYRLSQLTPTVVRIAVDLLPWDEPKIVQHRMPGEVSIALVEAAVPTGETDLETLPPLNLPEPMIHVPPSQPRPTPEPIAPLVLPAPTPTPAPASASAPLAWPVSPQEIPEMASAAPAIASKVRDFGSTIMLRWQQAEVVQDYGASTGPVFGYPTGVNGVELRQWASPWLGFGLDSRYLGYYLTVEGVRQSRTDLMLEPQIVARYPLLGDRLEPEVSLGYLIRQVSAYSALPGSSIPFSPTAFYNGMSWGIGGRVRLAPSVALQLDYELRPAIGGNLFSDFGTMNYGNIFPLVEARYEIALQYDLGPGFLTIGYSNMTAQNRGIGYSEAISGILAGGGLRY